MLKAKVTYALKNNLKVVFVLVKINRIKKIKKHLMY